MGRLFWKIFIAFWLTMVVIGLSVGFFIWQHNQERIKHLEVLADHPRADLGINRVASILEQEGVEALKHMVDNQRFRGARRGLPVYILDNHDKELFQRKLPELVIRKVHSELTEGSERVKRVTAKEGTQWLLFVPKRRIMHRLDAPLPEILPVIPLSVIFIASILFSLGLAFYITRPIKLLQNAAQKIALGHLGVRVMPDMHHRKDEITELARDFDVMTGQLQQLLVSQQQLFRCSSCFLVSIPDEMKEVCSVQTSEFALCKE